MNRRALLMSASLSAVWPAASLAQPKRASKLVGTWVHRVTILGVPHNAIVTFRPDGSFEEDAYTPAAGDAAAPPGAAPSIGMRVLGARGTWSVQGAKLLLHHPANGAAKTPAVTETRTIVKLTDSEFISTDDKFQIAIDRTRVTDPVMVGAPKQ